MRRDARQQAVRLRRGRHQLVELGVELGSAARIEGTGDDRLADGELHDGLRGAALRITALLPFNVGPEAAVVKA
jgi:hypothetical protein